MALTIVLAIVATVLLISVVNLNKKVNLLSKPETFGYKQALAILSSAGISLKNGMQKEIGFGMVKSLEAVGVRVTIKDDVRTLIAEKSADVADYKNEAEKIKEDGKKAVVRMEKEIAQLQKNIANKKDSSEKMASEYLTIAKISEEEKNTVLENAKYFDF